MYVYMCVEAIMSAKPVEDVLPAFILSFYQVASASPSSLLKLHIMGVVFILKEKFFHTVVQSICHICCIFQDVFVTFWSYSLMF